MEKISAVIITFNESRNIARCINSVKNTVDEVLVIDSHSQDDTTTIAKNLGAKVVLSDWMGYAKTKNYGNILATYNWILSLDADEELSDELSRSIQLAKEIGLTDTYFFKRSSIYCGKRIYYCGWYPDVKIRLFHRNYCHWSEKFIHETLTYPKSNKLKELKGIINHYSYYTVNEHLIRAKKYSQLSAKQSLIEKEKAIIVKMLFKPPIKFITGYIYKMGFMDGYYGIIICAIQAYSTFLKYYYRLKNELA